MLDTHSARTPARTESDNRWRCPTHAKRGKPQSARTRLPRTRREHQAHATYRRVAGITATWADNGVDELAHCSQRYAHLRNCVGAAVSVASTHRGARRWAARALDAHEDELHALVPAHRLLEEDCLVEVAAVAIDVYCAGQRGVFDHVCARNAANTAVKLDLIHVHQVRLHVVDSVAVAADTSQLAAVVLELPEHVATV